MRGYEIGGKYAADPIGSESRGKNRERRKSSKDPGALTPTESHRKAEFLQQFRRSGEGPGAGSAEFKENYERTFGHK